jgi:cytochrome c-type biogenesis protein CcmH
MSERLRNYLTVGAIVVMSAIALSLVASSPTEADRVERLGLQIKCPVCQGESIGNSPSEMARDMMALVTERITAGASDQQIVDELLSSFSGAVLLDPPASGSTLLLWLAPFLAFAVGVSVILWWRRHPSSTQSDSPEHDQSKGRRSLTGGLVLAGILAVVVIAAGFLLQDRQGPAEGVADQEIENLDEVSNETMEAVVAANADNSQINGMRLALAERYYEVADYRAAFPHYLAVAESPRASNIEAVTALVRLGWMAWDGNAEAEAALGLFDQALAIDPEASAAGFLKARVLWCGTGDAAAATDLLNSILANPNTPSDSRDLVQNDLDAIASGEACS